MRACLYIALLGIAACTSTTSETERDRTAIREAATTRIWDNTHAAAQLIADSLELNLNDSKEDLWAKRLLIASQFACLPKEREVVLESSIRTVMAGPDSVKVERQWSEYLRQLGYSGEDPAHIELEEFLHKSKVIVEVTHGTHLTNDLIAKRSWLPLKDGLRATVIIAVGFELCRSVLIGSGSSDVDGTFHGVLLSYNLTHSDIEDLDHPEIQHLFNEMDDEAIAHMEQGSSCILTALREAMK